MDINAHHLLRFGEPGESARPEEARLTYSTEEFAALGGFQPQTARKAYSAAGHYLNVRPKKLSNGRLRWPAAEVQALYRGGSHA